MRLIENLDPSRFLCDGGGDTAADGRDDPADRRRSADVAGWPRDAAGIAHGMTLSRAVLLPAIAAYANPKYRPAIRVAAKPLPENNFPVNRHPLLQAAFDNGCGSCQGKNNSWAAFALA